MAFRMPIALQNPLIKLLILILLLLFASTAGFYLVEKQEGKTVEIVDAAWWTIVTLTTVGYGDYVPSTLYGRLLGVVVMISGIGLVSTLTGSLASLLVERKAKKRKGLLAVNLQNHVVIMGWNGFAAGLVKTLQETHVLNGAHLVLVNNLTEEERNEIAFRLELGERLHFVWGDMAQENVVHKARPAHARLVYILSNQGISAKEADQLSIYAALTVRSLAPNVPLYGEVALPENREHLLRTGINEVIVRGEIAGKVMAHMGMDPSILSFMQQMLGLSGANLLTVRELRNEEKRGSWRDVLNSERATGGTLPLAVCQRAGAVSLQDVLDEGSALDQFIIELFERSGRATTLGRRGPRVLVNPADATPMEGYDTLLLLKPGGQVDG